MDFLNLSDKPLVLKNQLPGLERFILLPDHCPGKGLLPEGSVAVFDRSGHTASSEYLGPDVGCGMTLARFEGPIDDIEHVNYKIWEGLRAVKTELGSLGSGNHFINLYEVSSVKGNSLAENSLSLNVKDAVVVVHSGSRLQGKAVYESGVSGEDYLRLYEGLIDFARRNREKLLQLVEKSAGKKLSILIDKPHNTLEVKDERVLYRRGAIKLIPGEYAVLTSAIGREAVVIKGKETLSEINFSMCHGTGRKIPRSEAKLRYFNSDSLREKISIPSFLYDSQFHTEFPQCFRSLEEVMPRIDKYVSVVARLKARSYTC